ncbi:MAG: T9SS type A sorting domain-containing protein [Sediminibacterium sp.]|nr:T9SS type A sorting domain-containing protein [Sediminibacterium sp.]
MFSNILRKSGQLAGKLAVLSALIAVELPAVAQTISWGQAGPVTTPSRIRSLIFDNQDPTGNRLYAGSVTGGIFLTNDGGLNWSPLTDQSNVKNISCLAQSPNGVIYAGTGENYARPNQLAKTRPGTGVYTFANNTLLQVAGTSTMGNINKIVINPANAQRIYVASATGLYVSTDGGTTWAAGTSPTVTGQAYDLELASDGSAYVSVGDITGGSKVWRSTNGDPGSFTADITPTTALVPANYGRIEIAIPATNPNKIYISCGSPFASNNSSLAGLFVYENFANSQVPSLILEGSNQLDPMRGGGLGWADYSHALTVSPTNENQLLIGGYALYSWTRVTAPNIGTWFRLGNDGLVGSALYLPKNVHQILFKPNDANTLFIATDGSIYKSAGLGFIGAFNGLNATAFNNLAVLARPASPAPTNGSLITPRIGFLASGVTSGITYYQGNYPLVKDEENYNTGEFNNIIVSEILPKASVVTKADGTIWRTSDYTAQDYTQFGFKFAAGSVSSDFTNTNFSVTGTPFAYFENSGQLGSAPCDSLIFYNEPLTSSVVIPASTSNSNTPISFTFLRPQNSALLDSVSYVTTVTGTCGVTPGLTQTISVIVNPYTASTLAPVNPTLNLTGASSAVQNAQNFITIDNTISRLDVTRLTFSLNPAPNTLTCPLGVGSTVAVNSATVRCFAKAYYKYDVGAVITLTNTEISTKNIVVSGTITTLNSWRKPAGVAIGNTSAIKLPLPMSSRFAFATNEGISISRNMMNFGDSPIRQLITGDSMYVDGPGGVATLNKARRPLNSRVRMMEWASSGTELYFVSATTSGTNTTSYIYRVSHINAIIDSTFANYKGLFSTHVFNRKPPFTGVPVFTLNPRSPYRTTMIGRIDSVVTSLRFADTDGSLILSVVPSGTNITAAKIYVCTSPKTAIMSNTAIASMANFSDKTGNLPTGTNVFVSLPERNDNKKVLLGTSSGVFMTNDITASSPVWNNVNNNQIPNIEVYDLKQQKLPHWKSYNSGVIYAATNGRGVWSTNAFYEQSYVGVDEVEKTKNSFLKMYPNPSNGMVTIDCKSINGERLNMEVVDLMGKLVFTSFVGQTNSEDVSFNADLSSLNAGIYLVTIKGSNGTKHVGKLILSK